MTSLLAQIATAFASGPEREILLYFPVRKAIVGPSAEDMDAEGLLYGDLGNLPEELVKVQ